MTNMTDAQFDDLIQQEAFDQGTKVAQIFSGIFFAGLALWLTTANGGSLAFVQRAALEKRLTVCCFINMYVAMFSTFFNIFQLTNVDDAILPTNGGFTLDLARPIEWVLTCPLMQLSLVLMGGAKLPDYRRYLMPSFSIAILSCGTVAAFMPIMSLKILCFVLGVILFLTMASFNRLQIIEYSSGAECFKNGDSEFRKATLLLLCTWAPFPTWFVMSPEGFGIITNVLIIQVGWAFLNIVSKFTFIFYIQRIKDLYCNRLKTKRELTGTSNGTKKMFGVSGGGMHGSMSPPDFEMGGHMIMPGMDAQAYEMADKDAKREKLNAVVIETMNFLGMAQNTDRFVRLLEQADVICIADVEKLNQEKCEKLSLPFELVQALQKRVKVWKMDLVDEAEMELERGEEHYIKKLMDTPQGDHQMQMPHMHMQVPMPNMMPYAPQESGNGVGISAAELEDMLQKMEDRILGNQMQQLGQHESQQQKPQSNNMNMSVDVSPQMAVFFDKMQAMVASVEERLTQRIEATSKTAEHRAELRSFENRMSMKFDDKAREHHEDLAALEQRIIARVEQKVGSISTTVDTCCQKVDLCLRKIDSSSTDVSGRITEKLDAQGKSHLEVLQSVKDSHAKISAEGEVAWRQRFEELQNSMVCRHDEQDAVHKKRHDELIRQSAAKRIEELTSQVHNSSEASTSASKELCETIASELGSLTSKLTMKLDTMHAVHTKHHTEADTALQRCEESIAQKVSHMVEETVTDAAKRTSVDAAARMEKSIEQLDSSLAKRFQTAVEQAVTQGAQNGSNIATHKLEKALENWDSSQRAELASQTTRLLERIEDSQSSGTRKQADREDRQNRRIEEILEISTNRNVQKTEDVGLEIKKELHGFAKRLNTKIPFM